jgi:catechol 2,3-dioxygenase-like lactoylglutathione lyase family enzyme
MLGSSPAAATIAVSDIDRARKFYEETLGLQLKMEDPGAIMYGSGNTMVLVYPSQFAGTSQATVATWMVSDLDATVDELTSKGVTFEQYDMEGLKTDERGIARLSDEIRGAWFKDPDGNILNVGEGPLAGE